MGLRPTKLQLKIQNMHCINCEVAVERKVKALPGVTKVRVNHVTGRADIWLVGKEPPLRDFEEALKDEGYSVSRWPEDSVAQSGGGQKNSGRDYAEIGASVFLIVGLYLLLRQLDLVPDSASIAKEMSFGLAFVIGLVAAFSSCLAVAGGLLVTLAAKYNEQHPNLDGFQKFKPTLYFNVGRILSYTLFGGAVGALGSTLTPSPLGTAVLSILASAVMIIVGLQLLHLFRWTKHIQPRLPKFISHWIHDLSHAASDNPYGPFVLGALTFFLPCGFTQALQLYVLSTGNVVTGALTMLAFSLGTLPSLLSLSLISSFARGSFQTRFLRFAGVLVIVLGAWNIQNGLTLAGVDLSGLLSPSKTASALDESDELAPIIDGVQTVKMTVWRYNYVPSRFTVRAGVPVKWIIDGEAAAGCGQVLSSSSLGIHKFLSGDGLTIVTFTPDKPGIYPFNCSMGMMTSGAAFKVVP